MFKFLVFYFVLFLVAMRLSLQSNIEKWKSVGASDTVINWLNNGVKFSLSDNVRSFEFQNGTFSQKETHFLESEIESLLTQGCIDIAECKPNCVSPITCVPKKNGDFRLVTDLRHLTVFSEPPKFKYENINSVIKITQPKDYMITCDLKSGFFHIPVHKEHRTLLGFKVK